MSTIIDAGPMLNFLAVKQENVLIEFAKLYKHTLCVPERVETEVLGVAQNGRFARATHIPNKFKTLVASGHLAVLPDEVSTNASLAEQLSYVSGMPANQRLRTPRDLGEELAIAHCAVLACQGADVYLVIDESRGRALAKRTQQRLIQANAPGTVSLTSSTTLLRTAGQQGWIRGGCSWDQIYAQMQKFDDGLPPLC